jgi:glycogen phosphorylase
VAARRISEKQIDVLIKDLRTVANNLWWSWNPDAQRLFHELSPFFWEHSSHNAVEVVNWISGQELRGRLQQPEYFDRVSRVCKSFKAYMGAKNTWAAKHAPSLKRGPVAYFCAEFGLHESLRIYSGGLGMLSGDHSKSASDLGLPFYGITLFYRQGYFTQMLSAEGWQQERYPSSEPSKLAISRVTDAKGNPIILDLQLGKDTIKFQGWAVEVGRVKVFLLDTDLPENDQKARNLTAHVYGGDQWTRISQEIVLGIGGVRFLRALGIKPSVFHMNEGHSAFLTLELLREQLAADVPLDRAKDFVKKHCVFTTHTPVPAGHDRFDQGLINAALGTYAGALKMNTDQVMELGRVHPQDKNELFTMTVLALRMSRAANGVSELHGKTSQEMWKELYPDAPVSKVPIGGVTNGVHITGWTSHTAMDFWTRILGPRWIERLPDAKYWKTMLESNKISDIDLWRLRTTLRRELVEFARKRLREQNLRYTQADVTLYDNVLSPDVLTIGFARRFATYKRAPLFFRDFDWALKTLMNKEFPVQLIFAGKAHPRDDAGKQFIQQIVNITKRVDLFGKVVFLEDYDINVARHMVAGADVWLNTPRRPMEACGTSGMKSIIHGSLQLSTMDGWWREGYDGNNGWKIGEDTTASSEQFQDDLDAASLRSVVENKVIPLYYDRGKDGLPHHWLKMVRHSIATLTPVYNTDRMVQEYTRDYYLTK